MISGLYGHGVYLIEWKLPHTSKFEPIGRSVRCGTHRKRWRSTEFRTKMREREVAPGSSSNAEANPVLRRGVDGRV